QSGGPTRVALHADWDGANRPIGGCDGTSGPVPGHRAGTVACTLASAGWRAFYQRAISTAGGLPYGARYSVLPLAAPPDLGRLAGDADGARCGLPATRPAGCPAARAGAGPDAPLRA